MSSLVLHIWPGQWGLLSIHLPSLVAVLHLQLTLPGNFSISYCTNPDLSPSGTLPFLTHGQQTVTSLSSIIKYISSLEGDTFKTVNADAGLNSFEASQKLPGAYMLYSLPANWSKLTLPTLAYALPVPQRYYVPRRMRSMYLPRLEAAGLWKPEPIESKEQIAQTFQRDKVVQTARDCLDIYARLLGKKQFVYHERLTTLDIILAAHVLLIIKPPFPDTLLSDLLTDSYPTLVSHAERILSRSLEFPAPMYSSPGVILSGKSEEDTHYERMTWGWVGLAVGSVGLYLLAIGNPLEFRWSEREVEESK
ncbi:hypothetical protein B0H13DRAFT_1938065 [Mycena leptocephala]|nr:hypothetical protein B0H13DRAFT_1938065 [Mycena leptocephala]